MLSSVLVHQILMRADAKHSCAASIGPGHVQTPVTAQVCAYTSATQSSRSSRRTSVETHLVERVVNRRLLDVNDAAEDERSSRTHRLRQSRRQLDQDAGDDIGDHQIVFALERLSVTDAALFDTDDRSNAVAFRILPRGTNRDRFDVDPVDRARAE